MNTTKVDPMGRAIYDYFKNGTANQLIVRSDISEDDEIPVPYLFRSFSEMPEIEKKALQLCKGKVLDVGAGSGAHSAFLKSQGYNTTSIEVSPLMVEVMNKQGLNAHLADFFEFTRLKYDTLLFMMNGIGICGRLEQVRAFLSQCKKLLNPGGQVLLDSSDLIYLYGDEEQGYDINLNDNYYGEVNYQFIYNELEGEWFNWLFIDYDLLASLADENGFICQKVMDGPHYDYLAKLTLKS